MADRVRRAGGAGKESQELGRLVEGLPDEQQRALALLSEGRPIRETAQTVGINRGTLYRWIKADPRFRAAYNLWQLEQRESCRAGLLKCAESAVARVAMMVHSDQHLAFKVLKEMGLFRAGAKLKTEAEQVGRQIEIEELEEQTRLSARQLKQALEKAKVRQTMERLLEGNADAQPAGPPPAAETVTGPAWVDEFVETDCGGETLKESVEASEPEEEEATDVPPTDPPVGSTIADSDGAEPTGASPPEKSETEPVAQQSRRYVFNDVETRIG
ncbi:MAG TPA: helix-turn-helix domain-containing protein [Tepidisphaeraceae bacterium]|nr:helix-turn-helix domain-containing protein [Tepidisphaeraceae bacterium]